MEPRRVRRIVVPLIVGGVALLILLVYMFSPGRPATPPPAPTPAPAPEVAVAEPAEVAAELDTEPEIPAEPEREAPAIVAPPPAPTNGVSLEGLRVAAPVEADPAAPLPQSIGSLDPRVAPMLLDFNRDGAGVARIRLSDHWETAAAKRQADRHYAALRAGDPNPPPLPDEALRYLLKQEEAPLGTVIPILAASSIDISDPVTDTAQTVQLLWDNVENREVQWTETGPGRFELVIENELDEPVLRLSRTFELEITEVERVGLVGDITLHQRVENLSGRTLDVRWRQYGPGDLELERARYFDSRRFRFGWVQPRDPRIVLSDDTKLVIARPDAIKRYRPPTPEERRLGTQRDFHLWPNRRSQERQYVLSWFASTNRYFTLAVHPLLEDGAGDRTLTDTVEEILCRATSPARDEASLLTWLVSPKRRIAPGEATEFNLGVYAGPMDRHILATTEPYESLGMNQLILYMMSTWCAICTFQWLAHFLMWFMSFLHDWVLFDWGLAIIALVCVVRLLLHPLTKKSQVNIMRFGKQMQKMKPEVEKLQEKYKGDPKKLQQEQLRLMREHGVNPLQAVGCLPMFLQFPIWIALYAMLYFAFDLRHQPAFFGMFQAATAGYWPFLADLSSGDHFFGEFAEPVRLFAWFTITGINVLPILMGVVLFIHQKYMTPPPTATMTPEQIQQQKIMRVMMVVILPVVLYPAPSGLTLYIITSSIIGIIESRYVRAHVDQMDLEGPPKPAGKPKPKPKKKSRDPQACAYSEALDRGKEQAKKKKKGPPPSWKKRK